MNDELKQQIDNESKKQAEVKKERVPAYRFGYKDGYYDGATTHATRAITAEQEVERLRKALKDIKKGLNWIENSRELDIIYDALTPKPTTNDTEQ